jgi:hypothetical protein
VLGNQQFCIFAKKPKRAPRHQPQAERNHAENSTALNNQESTRIFSKALLASLPIAADLVLNHRQTLPALDEAQPVDEAIANLAASLAYELSMNWGPQIEVWAKLEKKLGLTTPKSGVDLT